MTTSVVAPLPFCVWPGCRERIPTWRQYCRAHRRAVDRLDGSRQARGYTNDWAAYSRARLERHPACVRCAARGFQVRATVTDHVIPAAVAPDRFWDPTNHQSLCARCNRQKAADDRRTIPAHDARRYR